MAIRRTRPSRLADDLATQYSASDPDALRARAIDAVLRTAEADSACWYTVGELDGVVRLSAWQSARGGDRSVDACFHLLANDPDPWATSPMSLRRPSRGETSAFQEVDSIVPFEEFEASPFFQKFFAPFGIRDQIRLLVFQGPRFIGWIGAVRKKGSPRFDARDRRRLSSLVMPVAGVLCAADAALRASLPAERAVVVLHPDGEVDYASIPSIGWLERPGFREALADATIAMDRGDARPEAKSILDEAECRLIRVDGEGSVRYVATLVPSKPFHRSFDHALTDVQRRVAASAAAGATIAEIANELGRGAETVRSHLREVYRRLEVSTRLELSRALQNFDEKK